MSTDRDLAPEPALDAVARARRRPGDDYTGLFLRPQFKPLFPDEAGAVAVFLSLRDRKRIALFPENREWCLVRVLPMRTDDRRGEAAHGAGNSQGGAL